MKFTNPIIPGFAPDPSIVKVRDIFYLVTSSFHTFPGIPIYASKNLRDWELKGHAICRPSQLDLSHCFSKLIPIPLPGGQPLVITGGLFAATIRFHDGFFYITCTNVYEDPKDGTEHYGNFFIKCLEDRIFDDDGWSDPIYFAFFGIDPSLFFDPRTGRAYVQGSHREGPAAAPDCSIRQFEIDIDTGKLLTDIRQLWKGSSTDAEGPHMYFKDAWYYLITAEAGTFERHRVGVARSRDIWGPYEGYDQNPLLTAYGRDEDIRWTGHADFFQDRVGHWFCVHLGIQYDRSEPARHPMGRETFLTPVEWGEGEWPKITQTQKEFEMVLSEADDDLPKGFTQGGPKEDLYIRIPELESYEYLGERGGYSLQASPAHLSTPKGTSTFVGRRQRYLHSSASTVISLSQFNNVTHHIYAGLTIYKDRFSHSAIAYDTRSRELRIEVQSIVDKKVDKRIIGAQSVSKDVDSVILKIQSDKDGYSFHVKTIDWQELGNIDSKELSGYDMTGAMFGIFANILHEEDNSPVREWVTFDKFDSEWF